MKTTSMGGAVGAAAFAAALVAATPAHALLQFSLNINGELFSCQDQAACDGNNTVGILQTSVDNFNGVNFLGSSQTSTKGAVNDLNTTSFQITNTNATPINYQLSVGDTDYTGPVTLLSQSGSGTFNNAIGSTIDLSYYADTANGQGGQTPNDFPGTLQADSGVITATLISDSFNFNDSSNFTDNDLFSMTLGTSGTLTAGGSLVGRSQDQVALQSTVVNEPASLAMLGGSLLGMGVLLRRRNRKDSDSMLTA